MKNSSNAEDSIFRKKGFFIALYSCLGVVASLALVVTIATRDTYTQYQGDLALYQEEAAAAAANQVEPYQATADDEAWFRPRQQPTPQPEPVPEPVTEPTEELPPPTPPPIPVPAPTPPPAPPTPTVEVDPNYFTAFTADDRLGWPVYGEVVMPFSMTQFIYDPTLDQFRTNDHLRISATEGDPVRASANGQVIAVGREARRGNYVTIDHGNGWVITYGQLMDEKLVSNGDIVSAGEIIGGVARQTIFTSLDGAHVHMHVMRDDELVNPSEWLAVRG